MKKKEIESHTWFVMKNPIIVGLKRPPADKAIRPSPFITLAY